MLKLYFAIIGYFLNRQPPSGGCVLKQSFFRSSFVESDAATFGWLCVETDFQILKILLNFAATFGWLCVETVVDFGSGYAHRRSHLRVAVC